MSMRQLPAFIHLTAPPQVRHSTALPRPGLSVFQWAMRKFNDFNHKIVEFCGNFCGNR